mmetsp:Transcript_18437/g.38019  ORF Transcript_18437/g.38019 Transcript_18437/m.38019 type:complete len:300 (-) Transcript_18437:218-1117(-)
MTIHPHRVHTRGFVAVCVWRFWMFLDVGIRFYSITIETSQGMLVQKDINPHYHCGNCQKQRDRKDHNGCHRPFCLLYDDNSSISIVRRCRNCAQFFPWRFGRCRDDYPLRNLHACNINLEKSHLVQHYVQILCRPFLEEFRIFRYVVPCAFICHDKVHRQSLRFRCKASSTSTEHSFALEALSVDGTNRGDGLFYFRRREGRKIYRVLLVKFFECLDFTIGKLLSNQKFLAKHGFLETQEGFCCGEHLCRRRSRYRCLCLVVSSGPYQRINYIGNIFVCGCDTRGECDLNNRERRGFCL